MKLVYGFIPIDESIEKMIEKRSIQLAKEIVMRTSALMRLEDQENQIKEFKKKLLKRQLKLKTICQNT